MGTDEAALVRLWQEKRGEVEPMDLTSNLIVQLGVATEDLNRHWFELNTRQVIKDRQCRGIYPWHCGNARRHRRSERGGVRGAAWSFSERTAVEKHMAEPQHNMWLIEPPLAHLAAARTTVSASSAPQTNPGTTPIFIDEVNAGAFEGGFYGIQSSHITGIATDLDVGNRISVDTCCVSELAHRPVHGRSPHPYLCACHRHVIVPVSQLSTQNTGEEKSHVQ
jgi:hypothetical protein